MLQQVDTTLSPFLSDLLGSPRPQEAAQWNANTDTTDASPQRVSDVAWPQPLPRSVCAQGERGANRRPSWAPDTNGPPRSTGLVYATEVPVGPRQKRQLVMWNPGHSSP